VSTVKGCGLEDRVSLPTLSRNLSPSHLS